MYVKVYTGDVLCTDGYIHYMKCTDILEVCTYTDVPSWFQLLICPAGWPVGTAGTGCCQVSRLFKFKFKHTCLIRISP